MAELLSPAEIERRSKLLEVQLFSRGGGREFFETVKRFLDDIAANHPKELMQTELEEIEDVIRFWVAILRRQPGYQSYIGPKLAASTKIIRRRKPSAPG